MYRTITSLILCLAIVPFAHAQNAGFQEVAPVGAITLARFAVRQNAEHEKTPQTGRIVRLSEAPR